jgi:hypothetical protein
MDFTILAAAAETTTEVVKTTDVGTNAGWVWALIGVVGAQVIGWVASWLNGKGKTWFSDEFTKLQAKLNEVSVLSQVKADDAVLKILADAIPDVLVELTDTAKRDLRDGKFDKIEWDGIGKRLWEKAKPHIEGGKNDYLANSSFADGQAVARMVIEKFFNKQQAATEGLVK